MQSLCLHKENIGLGIFDAHNLGASDIKEKNAQPS